MKDKIKISKEDIAKVNEDLKSAILILGESIGLNKIEASIALGAMFNMILQIMLTCEIPTERVKSMFDGAIEDYKKFVK